MFTLTNPVDDVLLLHALPGRADQVDLVKLPGVPVHLEHRPLLAPEHAVGRVPVEVDGLPAQGNLQQEQQEQRAVVGHLRSS